MAIACLNCPKTTHGPMTGTIEGARITASQARRDILRNRDPRSHPQRIFIRSKIDNSAKPEISGAPEYEAKYRSNLRDMEFNLLEVFDRRSILGQPPFGVNEKEVRDALDAMDRLARDVIGPTYLYGDRHTPVYDPKTRLVTMPTKIKEAFDEVMDQELNMFGLPAALGGGDAPPSVSRALSTLSLGANPAFHFYTLGPEGAAVIHDLAKKETDDDKRKFEDGIANNIIKNRWGVTMVMTEAEAGSDLGKIKTKAVRQKDGSWRFKDGVKRFITSGEHDLTDNIIHLVLARPEDESGNTIPGTKGLGLFIISKFHVDPETGDLIVEAGKPKRNGVSATNVEEKMGLKVSTTCELTLGEPDSDNPAVGYLIGEFDEEKQRYHGMNHMFNVIENARMMIGIKSAETLSRAHLDAVDYAKGRKQFGKPIIEHPEVRRNLAMQKAYAEGLRALIAYTTTYQDAMQIAKAEGNDAIFKQKSDINDLLLPVVKGFGSERVNHLLQDALQVFGGNGYMKGVMEQYMRDAKIDTLYEGTTQMQSLDLFYRKIIQNKYEGGDAYKTILDEIKDFAEGGQDGQFGKHREALGSVALLVDDMVTLMEGQVIDFKANNNADAAKMVGQNTERFLMAFGDMMVGYMLLRQAEVAQTKLDGFTSKEVSGGRLTDKEKKDKDFYGDKVKVAKFFAREVFPRIATDQVSAGLVDTDIMTMAF